MKLNRLQRHLERIYEISSPIDVEDFVVTDPEVASRIDVEHDAAPREEKLLVLEEPGGVAVSLYLGRALVDRLAADDPLQRLHPGNFADLCTALEGVSHFLYLTWSARYGRSVTLLDMETQAEVDKYITSAFQFARQKNGSVPKDLHARLFAAPSYHEDLDATSLERYRSANHFAGRYCSLIESHYLRARRTSGMLNDLRRFYRLPAGERARAIAARA